MISLNMFDAFCWGHQRQYESLWGRREQCETTRITRH
jgi:hypothetical protein